MTRQVFYTGHSSCIAPACDLMTRQILQTEVTSYIASFCKITRQILQTGATSRISSAFKMTQRLSFQTEFILPALPLLAK